MRSTEAQLVMYYVVFSFVALLGWAGIAQALNEPFDDDRRRPWRRASTILAVIGLLHPAVALVARDIAVQVDRDDDNERNEPPTRHLRLANWCTVASLIVAGTFLLIQTQGAGDDDAMRGVHEAMGHA